MKYNSPEALQLQNDLGNFYGTEGYTKYMFGLLLTDGVRFLAEQAECFWLIDVVASILHDPKVKAQDFLTIKFARNDDENGSGTFTADDGNGNIVYTQKFNFTTFPLSEIKMFLTSNVLMLTSEY